MAIIKQSQNKNENLVKYLQLIQHLRLLKFL